MLVTLCRPVLLPNNTPFPASIADAKGRQTEITGWPALSIPFALEDFPLTLKVAAHEVQITEPDENGIVRRMLNLTKGFLYDIEESELVPKICCVLQSTLATRDQGAPARNSVSNTPQVQSSLLNESASTHNVGPGNGEVTREEYESFMKMKKANETAQNMTVNELHHALAQFANETKQTAKWRSEAQEEVRRLQCDVEEWKEKYQRAEKKYQEEEEECKKLKDKTDRQESYFVDEQEIKRRVSEIKAELTQFKEENHLLSVTNSQIRVELEETLLGREQALNDLNVAKKEADSVQNAYEELQETFTSFKDHQTITHQEMIEEKYNEINDLEEQLHRVLGNFEVAINERNDMHQSLEEVKAGVEESESKYRDEVLETRRQIIHHEEAYESLKKDYDHMIQQLHYDHQRVLEENEKQRLEMNREEQEWNADRAQLQAEVEMLRPLADKCTGFNQVNISLQNVVDGLQEQLAVNDQRIFTMDKDTRYLRSEVIEFRTQNEQLQNQVMELKEKTESQATELKHKTDAMMAMDDSQTSIIRVLQEKFTKNEALCTDYEKEKGAMLRDQKTKLAEVKHLNEQLAQEKLACAKLREEVSELRCERTDRNRNFLKEAKEETDKASQIRRDMVDLASPSIHFRSSLNPSLISSTKESPTNKPSINAQSIESRLVSIREGIRSSPGPVSRQGMLRTNKPSMTNGSSVHWAPHPVKADSRLKDGLRAASPEDLRGSSLTNSIGIGNLALSSSCRSLPNGGDASRVD